jgi:hypothetical protein
MTAVPADTKRGASGISHPDVVFKVSKPIHTGPGDITITPWAVATPDIPADPVRVAAKPPPADNPIVASKNPRLNLRYKS